MNCDVKRCPDAMTDGVMCIRDVVARTAERIQQFPVLCLMQRVIDKSREPLSGLRSSAITLMSLEHALSGVRDEFRPESTVRLRIFVSGQSRTLNAAVQEQMYLIGREALLNAFRHSEATSIEAEVEYFQRRSRVIVRDNGCGIDPDMFRSERRGHWGIASMRERAESIGAQLRIWSRPSAGTEVEISVPADIVTEAA
jgi:signal transduction histidine kinase